jgi:hypothetical protein
MGNDANDASNDQVATPEGEGSPVETPKPEGSDPAAEIASMRKRQAGAEAARKIAEDKAKDLAAKLVKYELAEQTEAQKELTETARLTAQVASEKKRADEAEEKANGRILDVKYPNARKELPELTDEVRLAKFEAMLSDGEPITPLQHSESRGTAGSAQPKEETAAEVRARLLKMPLPGYPA